jgi:hypothetical protein
MTDITIEHHEPTSTISEARLAANRANALKSTGPKTEAAARDRS